jgi:hypothetical protein
MLASNEALHATVPFSPMSHEIGSVFTYRGTNSFQLTDRIRGCAVWLLFDMQQLICFLVSGIRLAAPDIYRTGGSNKKTNPFASANASGMTKLHYCATCIGTVAVPAGSCRHNRCHAGNPCHGWPELPCEMTTKYGLVPWPMSIFCKCNDVRLANLTEVSKHIKSRRIKKGAYNTLGPHICQLEKGA